MHVGQFVDQYAICAITTSASTVCRAWDWEAASLNTYGVDTEYYFAPLGNYANIPISIPGTSVFSPPACYDPFPTTASIGQPYRASGILQPPALQVAASALAPSGYYIVDGAPAQPCPGSTFSSGPGAFSSACSGYCTAGFVGQSGTSSPAYNSSQCGGLCPLNYYCPAGNTGAISCPTGTFGLMAGATSQANGCSAPAGTTTTCPTVPASCAAGSAPSESDSSSCSPCSSGSFGTGGYAACANCLPGTYQSAAGQSACVLCAAGSATSLTASQACAGCQSGWYAPTTGSTECSPCPAGSFSDAASGAALVSCTPCPANTSSSLLGSSNCSACAAGYYQPLTGQTTCMPIPASNTCAAGRFFNPAAQACSLCPTGYSCEGGAQSPVACSAGYIAVAPGSSSCTACAPGTAALLFASSQCTACPLGTFAGSSASSSCEPCAVGTFAAGSGNVNCSACPAATYQPLVAQGLCAPCPAGTTSTVAGSSLCVSSNSTVASPPSCTPGSWYSLQAQTCTLCPAGYSSAGGSQPAVACVAGTFSASNGSVQCDQCAAGTFTTSFASTHCSLCPAGTFGNNTGATACSACPAGSHSSSQGALSCLLCPAGQYQAQAGQNECLACPAGTNATATAAGSAACAPNAGVVISHDCPSGAYFDLTAQACTECPAGYVCAGGDASAEPCPGGYYNNATGQTACSECPLGTFASATGSSMCASCPAGSFGNATGQIACALCPAGAYTVMDGELSCQLCPEGSSAPSLGSTTCSECALGQYSDASGLADCVPCAVGSFADSTGSVECSLCAAGEYQPMQGQGSCYPCQPSTFSLANGSVSCEVCTSDLSLSLTQCGAKANTCPAGTSLQPVTPSAANNYSGAACVPCEAGYYSPSAGSTTCLLCPVNSYSLLPGSSSCQPCDGIDGVSCSNGHVLVDSGYWGYVQIQVLAEQLLDGDAFIRATLHFSTEPCPEGHCQGSNSTMIDWATLNAAYPNLTTAQSADDSAASAAAGGVMLTLASSAGVGLVGQCQSGFSQSSDNVLCGACEAGYASSGLGLAAEVCVPCSATDTGKVAAYVLVPWANVLVYYALAFGKPGLATVVLYFVQTLALMIATDNAWLTWLQFFGYSPTRYISRSACMAPMSAEAQLSLPLWIPVMQLIQLAITAGAHRLLRKLAGPLPHSLVLDPAAMRYMHPTSRHRLASHCRWQYSKLRPLLSLVAAIPRQAVSGALRARLLPELTVATVTRAAWLIIAASAYEVISTSSQYFYCVGPAVQLIDDTQSVLRPTAVNWAYPALACSTSSYHRWAPVFGVFLGAWVVIFVLLSAFVARHYQLLALLQRKEAAYIRRCQLEAKAQHTTQLQALAAEPEDSTPQLPYRLSQSAEAALDGQEADRLQGGSLSLDPSQKWTCGRCDFDENLRGDDVRCLVCRSQSEAVPEAEELATNDAERTELTSINCLCLSIELHKVDRKRAARQAKAERREKNRQRYGSQREQAELRSSYHLTPLFPIQTLALRPLPRSKEDTPTAAGGQANPALSLRPLSARQRWMPWHWLVALENLPWACYWPIERPASAASASQPAPDLYFASDPSLSLALSSTEPTALYRFRSVYGTLFDSWSGTAVHWTCVILLRQAALIAISVALALHPRQRYMAFALVHLGLLLQQLYFRPFLAPLLNHLEAISLATHLIVAVILDTYPPPDDTALRGVLLAIILLAIILMAVAVVCTKDEAQQEQELPDELLSPGSGDKQLQLSAGEAMKQAAVAPSRRAKHDDVSGLPFSSPPLAVRPHRVFTVLADSTQGTPSLTSYTGPSSPTHSSGTPPAPVRPPRPFVRQSATELADQLSPVLIVQSEERKYDEPPSSVELQPVHGSAQRRPSTPSSYEY